MTEMTKMTYTRNRMTRIRALCLALTIPSLCSAPAMLDAQEVPFQFENGTPADATEVNQNFSAISDFLRQLQDRVSELEQRVTDIEQIPPEGVGIRISSIALPASSSATINVTLLTNQRVAGTQNRITFPPNVQPHSCIVNPLINKTLHHSFLPGGCIEGFNCTSLLAIITDFVNLQAIPHGSLLYSCEIAASFLTGTFELQCETPEASDPQGETLETVCQDGTVSVF